MAWLSPGPYIFWSLVNGPLLLSAWEQSAISAIAFLGSFYGLFVGGNLALIILFSQTQRLGSLRGKRIDLDIRVLSRKDGNNTVSIEYVTKSLLRSTESIMLSASEAYRLGEMLTNAALQHSSENQRPED